uniref:Uncharacterized protein n=1 Tax=Kalanchoe fedtschenkoi TaxID=63787 RepID=A0A7N0RCH1_KALFE
MWAEKPPISTYRSPDLNACSGDRWPRNHRRWREDAKEVCDGENRQDDDDDEAMSAFEFSFDCAEAVSSPVSADRIFHNGKIKPIYSVEDQRPAPGSGRKPLRRLFMEETQTYSSPSMLSVASLESVPADSYCVWQPKLMRNKKKPPSVRWKLKDLLLTRNSSNDGASEQAATKCLTLN